MKLHNQHYCTWLSNLIAVCLLLSRYVLTFKAPNGYWSHSPHKQLQQHMHGGRSSVDEANVLKQNLIQLLSRTTAAAAVIATARRTAASGGSASGSGDSALAAEMAAPPDITVIPLEEYDSVYCVNYTVNGGVMYRAIVDSGSPFLIVPTVCTRQWGCAPKHPPFALAGYPPTIEVFGGQNYDSEWKVGFLRFPLAKAPYRVPPTPVVFAAVGYQVMLPPGGVFLGLIKDRCGDIRPTLMEQLQYNAFRFDAKNNELTLSRRPLIPPEVDAIRLLDLRPLGDPVYHYAARVKSLQINGVEIGMGTTIFAVFDTGCTGCVLSEDLVTDERTPGPPRRVRVVLETQSGGEQVVETFATKKRMFVVTSSRIPWFRLDSLEKDTTGSTAAGATARVAYASSVAAGGAVSRIGDVVVDSSGRIDTKNVKMLSDTATSFAQVVVIGLTFLRDKVLTIDIDDKRLTLGDT